MSGCLCLICTPRGVPGVEHSSVAPRVYVESRVHHEHDAAQADLDRIRAELADRLTRIDQSGDGPFHRDAALGYIADLAPDLLNEALDETGAPQ